MSVLLPRLARAEALALLDRHEGLSVSEIAAKMPDTTARTALSAVGGMEVSPDVLAELRQAIVSAARSSGYPGITAGFAEFEAEAARILRELLPITPNEASNEEVWSLITCCWLLDVAVWRWGSTQVDGRERSLSPTRTENRFIGNVNRNAFRLLWWRAEILAGTPFGRLNQDELQSLLERPSLSGIRPLVRAMADEHVKRIEADGRQRAFLLREVAKRVRRLMPFVQLTALDDSELRAEVAILFDDAERRLGRAVADPVEVVTERATTAPSPDVEQVEVLLPTPAVGADVDGARLSEELDEIAEIALDIVRRTGRVSRRALRDITSIDDDEANAVLTELVIRGKLVRRGTGATTHYVFAEKTPSPDLSRRPIDTTLRKLLRRRRA